MKLLQVLAQVKNVWLTHKKEKKKKFCGIKMSQMFCFNFGCLYQHHLYILQCIGPDHLLLFIHIFSGLLLK